MIFKVLAKVVRKLVRPVLLAKAMGSKSKVSDKNIIIELWRPIYGYVVSFSWLIMILSICYVVVKDSENASEIIIAFSETTSLWGGVLGVLGISVIKNSQIKPKKNIIKKPKKSPQK